MFLAGCITSSAWQAYTSTYGFDNGHGSIDTYISRPSPDVFYFGASPGDSTGTLQFNTAVFYQGQATGPFYLQEPKLQPYTVAQLSTSLPQPGSTGTMVLVSDASTQNVGTCVGGGSFMMIAVYTGSSWTCH